MKFLTLIIMFLFILSVNAENKKDPTLKQDEVWVCSRWMWTSYDIVNQKVVCLDWKKQDCSLRMYKNICKAEGTTNKISRKD